jgi:hypothetical protein
VNTDGRSNVHRSGIVTDQQMRRRNDAGEFRKRQIREHGEPIRVSGGSQNLSGLIRPIFTAQHDDRGLQLLDGKVGDGSKPFRRPDPFRHRCIHEQRDRRNFRFDDNELAESWNSYGTLLWRPSRPAGLW